MFVRIPLLSRTTIRFCRLDISAAQTDIQAKWAGVHSNRGLRSGIQQ